MVEGTPPPACAELVDLFRRLYGEDVLSKGVIAVLNSSFGGRWVHVVDSGVLCVVEEQRGILFAALYKALLVAEEKPVVTRFWTFGVCLRVLLQMRLLAVPDAVFELKSVQPASEGAKRLKGWLW